MSSAAGQNCRHPRPAGCHVTVPDFLVHETQKALTCGTRQMTMSCLCSAWHHLAADSELTWLPSLQIRENC